MILTINVWLEVEACDSHLTCVREKVVCLAWINVEAVLDIVRSSDREVTINVRHSLTCTCLSKDILLYEVTELISDVVILALLLKDVNIEHTRESRLELSV